jgi:hypothetical protein
MEATRASWAYHRLPAERCERALSLVGHDCEPVARPGWVCDWVRRGGAS